MKKYQLNESISDKERVALWETHGWCGLLSGHYPLARKAFAVLRGEEIPDDLRAKIYDEVSLYLSNEQMERQAHGGEGSYSPARFPNDDDVIAYINKACSDADKEIEYYRTHPNDTNAKYFAKKLSKCTF